MGHVTEKFRNITQIPICANYMSFERARRAESNDTKIKDRSKLWAEIQVPEVQKREGGSKLIFGGEKFEYTNDSSFERAYRAESNDTKINAI